MGESGSGYFFLTDQETICEDRPGAREERSGPEAYPSREFQKIQVECPRADNGDLDIDIYSALDSRSEAAAPTRYQKRIIREVTFLGTATAGELLSRKKPRTRPGTRLLTFSVGSKCFYGSRGIRSYPRWIKVWQNGSPVRPRTPSIGVRRSARDVRCLRRWS